MSVFGDVIDSVMNKFRALSNDPKTKSIDRDDLRDLLEDNLAVHKCILEVLTVIKGPQLKDWMQNKVDQAMREDTSTGKDSYTRYIRSLTGKAKSLEMNAPFGSLIQAHKNYIDLLNDVLKNLDTIVDKETITIYNARISLLALLTILKKSDVLSNFSEYLFSYLVRVSCRTQMEIPKYRFKYLEDHADEAAQLVSDLIDRKNDFDVVNQIEQSRRKFADFEFSQNGQFTKDKADFIKGQKNLITLATISAVGVGIAAAISLLGTVFGGNVVAFISDWKLSRHEKRKEMLEWMRTHVAVLRMNLNDLDASSPEYAKLESIIKAYDDKIAEYDEIIAKFESEV